jgi:hypothetical protein
MCILFLAQVRIKRSSYNRRIQQYDADLQLKKDRWILRKGVEAADDEQEILRLLRQIADAFVEFQVRASSSRALTEITDKFQTKILLRIERNTDHLIQVCALIGSMKVYVHGM